LKAVRSREQIGIDGHRSDRTADLPHRLAYRIEESMTGILHEMPTVSNLNGIRQSLGRCAGVSAAAITSDDGNLRLFCKPGLGGCGLTVGQEADGSTPLEITNDRPVALVASPCPVIDADYRWRRHRRATTPADDAKQRVVADWQHQPPCKARRRAATQGKAQMMNETVKAAGPASPWRHDPIAKAPSENSSSTRDGFAAETVDSGYQLHPSPRQRQVSDLATVVAMNAATARSAAWTKTGRQGAGDNDCRRAIFDRRTDDSKAWWYDRRRP
jgi:hypothetical protein